MVSFLLPYGLLAVAEAHMLMTQPIPYPGSTNEPLFSNGTNFPCQLHPSAIALQGTPNVYGLGSINELSFKGSVTHGGGSCQVSMTYDKEPSKGSVWKVLTSIEGGCPAQGQTGNLVGGADMPNPYRYQFKIPADIPAGQGTIAWTWFNKVGNREMYMNCGPLTLTGAGGSYENFERLPDLFKAHIDNDCYIPENSDVVFPDPGKDVVRLNGATDAFMPPIGTGCNTAGTPRNTDVGSVHASVSSASASITVCSELPGPSSSHSVKPQVSVYMNTASASSCSSEGSWKCIDGKEFQRCVHGAWSEKQELAAGIVCEPGESLQLTMQPE